MWSLLPCYTPVNSSCDTKHILKKINNERAGLSQGKKMEMKNKIKIKGLFK